MKTLALLAVMMLSAQCWGQKSKALQADLDACQATINSVIDDSITIINENETLKIKIADLEAELEKSQTMAKFWAEFAAQGLKSNVPINSVPATQPSSCTTQYVYDTAYTICD